jgi:NUMOD3 motif
VIYGLIDGDTLELRYVGQTTQFLDRRLKDHRKLDSPNLHFNNWIKVVSVNALVLERDPEDLNGSERRWIREMREQGARLLNLADGGYGCGPCLPETREKIRVAKIGRPMTEEARANMSAAQKRRLSPNSMLGRHHSAETRAKLSIFWKGRKFSTETCAKISAAKQGKPLSFEHRIKLSIAGRLAIRSRRRDRRGRVIS